MVADIMYNLNTSYDLSVMRFNNKSAHMHNVNKAYDDIFSFSFLVNLPINSKMFDSSNFFFRNRNETYGKLYFKLWLPKAYFPTVEVLRKGALETALKRYNNEFNEAILMCKQQKLDKNVRKLEEIFRKFLNISQASSWKRYSFHIFTEK